MPSQPLCILDTQQTLRAMRLRNSSQSLGSVACERRARTIAKVWQDPGEAV